MAKSTIPSIQELIDGDVVEFQPVPPDVYNATVTEAKVRKGKKGPYLNLKLTIFDGDQQGRSVYGISSFSEKALKMPGGPMQLIQASGVGEDIDSDISPKEIPAAVASALRSTPVTIAVEHEHDGKEGAKKYNADGTPTMRARIKSYAAPSDEFLAGFAEYDSEGDDDVPF